MEKILSHKVSEYNNLLYLDLFFKILIYFFESLLNILLNGKVMTLM